MPRMRTVAAAVAILRKEGVTDLFGLPAPVHWGPFMIVEVANGVSLDYHEIDGEIASQHYAFLIGENDFDEVFGRIVARGLDHWADPGQNEPGTINHAAAAEACERLRSLYHDLTRSNRLGEVSEADARALLSELAGEA